MQEARAFRQLLRLIELTEDTEIDCLIETVRFGMQARTPQVLQPCYREAIT